MKYEEKLRNPSTFNQDDTRGHKDGYVNFPSNFGKQCCVVKDCRARLLGFKFPGHQSSLVKFLNLSEASIFSSVELIRLLTS